MGKRSTRLKIVFFSLLLAGFMVIQYCWMMSLQKDKSEEFKYRIITGINSIGQKMQSTELTVAAVSNLLRQSFFSIGLSALSFEYAIDENGRHLASPGFRQQLINNSGHLTLHYVFDQNRNSEGQLTVVVPFWNRFIWKKMIWPIAASVLLTIMIVVIFCYASILGARNQQSYYDIRTKVLKNMLQQLETPLSTMSVAAEALRNARVMQDAGKMNYYQRVINEENKRMNEQVEKFLREIK
jgi:two-component system, OmpR family, phosphate regulon sensor histidine kinase PhoR